MGTASSTQIGAAPAESALRLRRSSSLCPAPPRQAEDAASVVGALHRLRRASSKCAPVLSCEDGVRPVGAPNEPSLCTAFTVFAEYSSELTRDLDPADDLEVDEISLAMIAAFDLHDQALNGTLFALTRQYLATLQEHMARHAMTASAAEGAGLRAVAGFLIQLERYVSCRAKEHVTADVFSWFGREGILKAAGREQCDFCGLCGHTYHGCVGAFAKCLAEHDVISLDADTYAKNASTLVTDALPLIAETVKKANHRRCPKRHRRSSLRRSYPMVLCNAIVSP